MIYEAYRTDPPRSFDHMRHIALHFPCTARTLEREPRGKMVKLSKLFLFGKVSGTPDIRRILQTTSATKRRILHLRFRPPFPDYE